MVKQSWKEPLFQKYVTDLKTMLDWYEIKQTLTFNPETIYNIIRIYLVNCHETVEQELISFKKFGNILSIEDAYG